MLFLIFIPLLISKNLEIKSKRCVGVYRESLEYGIIRVYSHINLTLKGIFVLGLVNKPQMYCAINCDKKDGELLGILDYQIIFNMTALHSKNDEEEKFFKGLGLKMHPNSTYIRTDYIFLQNEFQFQVFVSKIYCVESRTPNKICLRGVQKPDYTRKTLEILNSKDKSFWLALYTKFIKKTKCPSSFSTLMSFYETYYSFEYIFSCFKSVEEAESVIGMFFNWIFNEKLSNEKIVEKLDEYLEEKNCIEEIPSQRRYKSLHSDVYKVVIDMIHLLSESNEVDGCSEIILSPYVSTIEKSICLEVDCELRDIEVRYFETIEDKTGTILNHNKIRSYVTINQEDIEKYSFGYLKIKVGDNESDHIEILELKDLIY
ncbi:hypothetical protein NGRA_1554 [Nosema granulosis]|uniref:Uncharacterized protein n=1 Tax=Nosema granulosis TaxID=83296 RepID=A0A9P6H1J2_9MICR|nr:hypothetical protein NGRA_1554 [Nosema granulosis]